jgi:two-component system chemotaxis response regulator CheB
MMVAESPKLIRVLVVDDSSFMRLIVSDILQQDNQIIVVDTAKDGQEAHQKTLILKPDVIVLDIVMQDYDGLYAVKKIMQEIPTPIIILSSEGNVHPEVVVEALNAGAVSFVNKPRGILQSKIREIEHLLIEKVKIAAQVPSTKLTHSLKSTNNHPHTFDSSPIYEIVVIGASTGGTGAVEHILLNLPNNFPLPVLIAQHIPEKFVHSFAQRLDKLVSLHVKVANENEYLEAGTVYIAPCHANTEIKKNLPTEKLSITFTHQQFPQHNYPSIDCLMLSTATVCQHKAIGILLTGMGKDGAKGLVAMHQAGAFTIAQDEKTSIVFGMPKAAIEEGGVSQVLPLNEIAQFVVSCL